VSVTEALLDIVERNRGGEAVGLPSVCSAEPIVLEAAIAQAVRDGSLVCIESTCNQVNQFGGYTGMTPIDFRSHLDEIADDLGLPGSRIVLGGDHLGPWPWRNEPAASAMSKARELVRDCVLAGYTKIHLDASMRCGDDPGGPTEPLDEEVATERTADLCRTGEDAFGGLPAVAVAPLYVIGTEVPIPGGEQAETPGATVSRVEDVERTVSLAREAFARQDLRAAWERVIAVVAQPGVEFGDEVVFDYDRDRASDLSRSIEGIDGLVFEAHSTDHQTAEALRRMVEDHFAILKVGPWLTFAMREALFGLEAIERELTPDAERSCLRETLERAMVERPEHWRSYHRGDERALRLARAFSYSDRCRYYWPRPELRAAVERLLANLSERPIPPTLLSQFLPRGYEAVRRGELAPVPLDLVRHAVLGVLDVYASACGMR
jgi:D-tagatose-1,6-bisphosphate aldolase subunit GatZ/KbaZ